MVAIGNYLFGFFQGRSTAGATFILKMLQEKYNPSVWSLRSCSANLTTATLYLQAFLSRPSDHQTVAACNECCCSSHHGHQAKRPDHSSADVLTLAADKLQILYKQCLLMHRSHTNQQPVYMAEMVEFTAISSSRYGLRSASHFMYRKPALKTKFGEQAFSHAAWNSLPDYIQSESDTKHLKKLLKTYLFTLSF